MNAQQAAHWRMLAEKHADTPGDLAEVYRVIGELIDEKTALLEALYPFSIWDEWYSCQHKQRYGVTLRSISGTSFTGLVNPIDGITGNHLLHATETIKRITSE